MYYTVPAREGRLCEHFGGYKNINRIPFISEATPIYLLVLRAQEVGNEPFWNKKKVEKCDFLFFKFFLESAD